MRTGKNLGPGLKECLVTTLLERKSLESLEQRQKSERKLKECCVLEVKGREVSGNDKALEESTNGLMRVPGFCEMNIFGD